MKKQTYIFCFLAAFLLSAGYMKAQQLPQYSQYMLNDYVLNPAITGSKDYFEGKSDNRYQWEGITDAPRTYILSVHGPFKSKKVGLGGYLFTDITGPTRRTGFALTYAYHLKITENIKLGMGLSGGLLQFLVDGSKINLRDEGDQALSNGIQSVLVPDFGAGLYLYSKKFYVGGSAPQLMQNKLRFFDRNASPLSKLEDHYFALAGYKFNITDDFIFEPSALMKMVKPVPIQFDFGARISYKEKVWLGGAYRTDDAISAMIGFSFENLMFGYAHDFTTTNIKNYSTGTHELMIGVKFMKQNKPAASAN